MCVPGLSGPWKLPGRFFVVSGFVVSDSFPRPFFYSFRGREAARVREEVEAAPGVTAYTWF